MKSSLKNMVLVLTGITAVLGGVLALVHDATAEPIKQAEAKAKSDALAQVLPAFAENAPAESVEVTPDGETRPLTVYVSQDGGMAIETYTTEGFSGEITVMVGFDSNGTVTGYKVLSHAETPGLGAKADEWFRDERHTVIGSTAPMAIGTDIDGITAATITSRAFVDALNRARNVFNKMQEK